MRHGLVCAGVILLTGFSISTTQQQDKAKDNAAATAPAAPTGVAATTDPAKAPTGADRKNPVKETAEGHAAAKKIFGYDCAMCHGAAGDGKGDLASSMSLTLKNWGESGSLAGISDGDIFDIIMKGKGKMPSNGDRLTPEKAWNLVHYVRSFAKKNGSSEKSGAAATPPQS